MMASLCILPEWLIQARVHSGGGRPQLCTPILCSSAGFLDDDFSAFQHEGHVAAGQNAGCRVAVAGRRWTKKKAETQSVRPFFNHLWMPMGVHR